MALRLPKPPARRPLPPPAVPPRRSKADPPPKVYAAPKQPANCVKYRDEHGVVRWANGRIPQDETRPRTERVNWNNRHQLVLWMDIAGERVADIAKKVGYAATSVSAIRASPLYQQQRAMLYEKLAGTRFDNLIDFLKSPLVAIRNIEVMLAVRDDPGEHGGDPKVRLAAAKAISHEVDRAFPRTTKHEEEKTIRVSLDGAKLARIATALHEAGAVPIDVTPEEPNDGRPPISAKSIEQLRTELATRVDETQRRG